MQTAFRTSGAFFSVDSESASCYSGLVRPRHRQQWWQATTEHQAAARFVVAETRGSNQEFAVDRCDRHRAFAVVFLALFGLLFFVSPAGV